MSIDKLNSRINSHLEGAERVLAEFKIDFDTGALYALSWGDKVFLAAARQQVCCELLRHVEHMQGKGEDFEEIVSRLRSYATAQAVRAARSPARSTSPSSNLAEASKAQAWAEILDWGILS